MTHESHTTALWPNGCTHGSWALGDCQRIAVQAAKLPQTEAWYIQQVCMQQLVAS